MGFFHALRFSGGNRGENASVCVCEQICQRLLHLCSFRRSLGLPHMVWGINLGEQDRHSRLFLCSFKGAWWWGSMFLCSFITARSSYVPFAGAMRGGVGRTTQQTGAVQGDFSGKQSTHLGNYITSKKMPQVKLVDLQACLGPHCWSRIFSFNLKFNKQESLNQNIGSKYTTCWRCS
jgi:hypothetical protein